MEEREEMKKLCTIGKIKKKKDPTCVRPIVVSFENGSIKRGKESKLRCNVYRNKSDELIAAVANKKIVYSGLVNSNDELYNNFLGIRNTETGQMKLIAIDYATLTPVLKSSTKTNETFTRYDLQREFGSKKGKRAMEQMRKMQMDVENVKDDLQKTVAAVEINEADLTTPVVENEYFPPINRQAKNIEEVYDLYGTVPQEVLDSLEEHASQIFADEYPTTEFLPYIAQQIESLKESNDHKRTLKCKVLIYLDCAIKFLGETVKNMMLKSYRPCDYCEAVNDHILSTFTASVGNRRTRSAALKHKCLCYILVLCLIVNNYRLNLEQLAPMLKFNVKKIQEFLKAMGCHATTSSAQLQIPLATSVQFSRKRKN